MKKLLPVAALAALMSGPAFALDSFVGDVDCFGLAGGCADGATWTSLGGVFFTSYQTAGDPSFTDKWGADVNFSYVHSYSLGQVSSASLSIRTAGIADVTPEFAAGPWDVFFNNTQIGQFTQNAGPNAPEEVRTFAFNVPVALLTGNDTVRLAINTPVVNDGYGIDYSRLNLTLATTPPTPPIPEPSTYALMLAGLGLVGLAARRRRR